MRRVPGALPLAVALVLLTGSCSRPASPIDRSSGPGSSTTAPGPAATASAVAATAGLTGETPGSPSSAPACTVTVGAQLRERTTVTAAGAVMMLAGSMPCRAVGVWVSSFALDGDAAADPTPQFAGPYTGTRQLAAKLPPVGSSCSAAAVYFSAEANDAQQTGLAAKAALAVRTDLIYWPAGQRATVPGAMILQGRPSGVLAAAVGGDPARCSPGPSLASPTAALGDCWLAAPAAAGIPAAGSPGTASAQSGFRKTTCGAQHTHEVYWVEGVTPQDYLQHRASPAESASSWARRRANEVCVARRSALRLAADVSTADVFLELLWPSTLDYPPAGAGWSKAQIVCLVRWKDGKPSDRHILHR
jgi:hypothetical protein